MTWLTAAEALQMLGVRPQTLYANVSRKKIRAKPDPKDTRRSLYHDADVRKMARQRGGQRKATAVAAAAIEWGDPILSSAISTAVDGRLYYRGQDAVVLSEDKTLEEVAWILWGGRRLDDGDPRDDGERNNGVPSDAGDRRVGGPHGSDDRGKGRRVRVHERQAASDDSKSSPLQRAFLALGLDRKSTRLNSSH